MGFLDAYSGTRTIHFGADDRYWIKLREHVSQGEKEGAEKLLANMIFVNGKAQPNPDVARFRQLTVLSAIVEWNLDDEAGVVWPITLTNVKRLPGVVFDEVWGVLDEINSPADPTERRQFPDGGVGGDPDGSGSAAGAGGLPGGEGAVEAPGAVEE